MYVIKVNAMRYNAHTHILLRLVTVLWLQYCSTIQVETESIDYKEKKWGVKSIRTTSHATYQLITSISSVRMIFDHLSKCV